jgi:pimeloyl-ACP methyl ester carboxylesterase
MEDVKRGVAIGRKMPSWRAVVPLTALALAAVGVVACTAEPVEETASDKGQLAYKPNQFDAQLAIPLTGSPLASKSYEFCAMDRGLNLPNAVMLAWMSANAYGDHFGSWKGAPTVEGIASVQFPGAIMSAFRQLGFGNPGEDAIWTREGARLADAWRDNKSAAQQLATRMFTQFDSNRGIGKLHGTNPEGYKDGNERFSAASTQVYFLHNRTNRTAVIAFRGTQPVEGNRADVYADLDYDLVDLEDGTNNASPQQGIQVHRGFRTALFERTGGTSSIERRLVDRLKLLPAETQVWITGHSLGGALANVFALLALREQEEKARFGVAGLVTFGAPEVGNAAFGAELRRRLEKAGALHQRFVYGRDPVPRVVEFGRQRTVFFRELDAYQHATRVSDASGWPDARFGSLEIQLPCVNAAPQSGKLFSSPVPSDVSRCAVGLNEIFAGQADHAIRNYYNALVRALRETPKTHAAQQCRKTNEWRAACSGLLECLSNDGGASCASGPNCAAGVCDDLRRCESVGNGGWSCFETYCGASPKVPESVRACWSGNGGWGCFR